MLLPASLFLFSYSSIHTENKTPKKKSSKKASRKKSAAADADSNEGSQGNEKPSAKSSPAPKAASVLAKPVAPGAGFRPEGGPFVGGPGALGGGAAFGRMGGAPGAGGLGNAANLDMMAYQNILRQRELAALREQQAMQMGVAGGPGGMESLLRGGGGAGMSLMDRQAMASGPSSSLMGGTPGGFAGLGLSGGYGGFDRGGMPESARSSLSPEEQLYLLRRNQDEMSLSLRQRLELVNHQQQARHLPPQQFSLMDLQQQQQSPQGMAMMQERARLMERQRLEQMLINQSLAGMAGPSGMPRY